ncbi:SulP family inorganic anion transporter [Listeria sp. FSL L7-1485]|uniref:SulP family inorganic anion transporter n=1 Tax=Listeria immobilis TaxID=2713502 RepID=A0A7X0X957_9LIST|nr:SulP family inorganic anion transporter [Listeria immobilis]MBC1483949.1 SulP family inorganic anion transporter [Listeria immobilis]MBC1489882.1 SulP family inorganic anion transporter [Listeria immobilis]MBC1505395.1 SulP family inorganic anion transporter [Listeria immobilis]MBC1509173.1 SulP family inorganic anion transporter [Listeria immobilis]MBC1514543.1 SulP family inorganic anion transporter [Listeria immobilis]
MFKHILLSLNGYKASYLKNDVISGVGVAALTIPVAMGYAQVAGLPPIYGLYASFLPVIAYVIFASSPQLIFGIDATASAITGSIILGTAGLAAGSKEAIALAPILAFFCAVFLVLFSVLKLGRFAKYISAPVLSGFISGLSVSIIMGQIPKIMGLKESGDSFFSSLGIIVGQFFQSNWISLAMGVATVIIVISSKKAIPKVPMSLVVLMLGTLAAYFFKLDQYNVDIVGKIPVGFPSLALPDFGASSWALAIGGGLICAIATFAGSLLPSESFALRNKYTIDDNRELFSYGISNFVASISGCPPASASVSRTAANEQFHGKTQMVSIVAATIIALIVALLSGLLYYMPQPVLSGIVFAALVGIIDVDVLKGLFKVSRREATVWIVAALGTLLVGVIFGVLLGIALSFINVVSRSINSPIAILGVIEGRHGYFDLKRKPEAKPIPNVVIYRYSASLFFGNFNKFADGLKEAIQDDTKLVIFEASAIINIDTTATESMKDLLKWLDDRGIEYYFADLIDHLKTSFRKHDLGYLIDNGYTKKTVEDALDAYHSKQK